MSEGKGVLGMREVSISEIRENPVALRNVSLESEDFLGLVASIREHGILNAISVRPRHDDEADVDYFELVDGLHRFCGAKEAGLESIPAIIKDLDDDKVLEAQIVANLHKIETKPVQYSQQLRRILARNPMMTESELAAKCGKSPQWIRERLGLTKITNESIATLVDEGKIKLANAYALAKLPPEEMADFVDRAMTLPPDEFVPQVNARVKEIREAKRSGKDAAPQEFVPVAFLQKLKAIKDELESGEIAEILVKSTGVKKPVDAFALGIKWVLHLDPESVESQKVKDEERKAKRKDEKERKAVEKSEKNAAKAAEKAKEAAAAAEKAKRVLAGEEEPEAATVSAE